MWLTSSKSQEYTCDKADSKGRVEEIDGPVFRIPAKELFSVEKTEI